MSRFRRVCRIYDYLFHRDRIERELDEELHSYVQLAGDDKIDQAMPREHAERIARIELGGIAQLKEADRAARPGFGIDSISRDIRYGLRTFRQKPLFTVVVLLTLGVGIGTNTAILSIVDALLLREPPFENVDRLVTIYDTNPNVPPEFRNEVNPSPGNFLDWQRQTTSFERMVATRVWYFTLSDPQGSLLPQLVRGAYASPSLFDLLGVRAQIGRTFEAEEGLPGQDLVVMLSDSLWKTHFGEDPEVVGQTMLVDGRQRIVIGVLPQDFLLYQPDLDLWAPLNVDSEYEDRETHSLNVHALLAPDVTIAQAREELDGIARRLEIARPDTNAGWGVTVELFRMDTEVELRGLRPALILVLVASTFVLLIACANVANLLLARGSARRRELTIRSTLGASRRRLVAQMLTESLMLAAVSAVLGLALAEPAARLLYSLLPHNSVNQTISAFVTGPSVNLRILGFCLVVTVGSTLAFGLVPALQNTGSRFLRGIDPFTNRRARLLVSTETALSVTLLVGALLLLQSFARLQQVDPGFRTDGLLTMQLWLPEADYPNPDDSARFYNALLLRVRTLPGVEAAGAVNFRPYHIYDAVEFELDDDTSRDSASINVVPYRSVTPAYFQMLGQPLLAGRAFTERDGADSAGVAIINEAMARRYWPDEDPIGRRIRPRFSVEGNPPWRLDAAPQWLQIVGIVGDTREVSLDRPPDPALYLSFLQHPSAFSFLVVRTSTAPGNLAMAVQARIREVDSDQAAAYVQTMNDAILVSTPRFNVHLLTGFGGIALLLSAVGVYAVTSYSVAQRRKEIGVRMAIGAEGRDVVQMIVREGLGSAGTGVLIGIAGAYLLTRTMASLLFGVAPTDIVAFVGAAALMTLVSAIACYVPARRAVEGSPFSSLKVD